MEAIFLKAPATLISAGSGCRKKVLLATPFQWENEHLQAALAQGVGGIQQP
jgi:hypothetical protein